MSKVKVAIIESESGWGSRVDEIIEFDDKESALKYVDEYNQKYNPDMGKPGQSTPSWYMIAQLWD